MKSFKGETFSRWMWQGVLLLTGIGVIAGVVVHVSFGVPPSRLAIPIAALLAVQIAFYAAMFAARKRYQRTRDLRAGFIAAGIYGLFIALAGMYFAGRLGIIGARTFEDNFVGFSVFMGVVICVGFGLLSFLRPKLTRQMTNDS